MTPVYMTKFYHEKRKIQGNHLACCIASLLHLGLDKIPNLQRLPRDEMISALQEFLFSKKLELVVEDNRPPRNQYSIALGKVSYGVTHSVVMFGADQVHNPHPAGVKIKEIYAYISFRTLPVSTKLKKAQEISGQGGRNANPNSKGNEMNSDTKQEAAAANPSDTSDEAAKKDESSAEESKGQSGGAGGSGAIDNATESADADKSAEDAASEKSDAAAEAAKEQSEAA